MQERSTDRLREVNEQQSYNGTISRRCINSNAVKTLTVGIPPPYKEVIMLCDQFHLRRFFYELISLSIRYPGRHGYGVGCSLLIEVLVERNESFINRIIENEDNYFNEYRLNGAGLKLHWRVIRKDGAQPQFQCYISGDQVQDYPDFVVMAKYLIKKWGCNHR